MALWKEKILVIMPGAVIPIMKVDIVMYNLT